MCYEDPRNCSPANGTRLNRLPTLDPDGEVTGILTALLRAARQHADFGKWLALKNAWGDDLDGIRAAMADPGREIITAELDGRRAVSAIGTVVAQFGGTPALVLIAGIARGLDDLYGDYLLEPWLRDRLGKGPIQADELVVLPGIEHLRSLFGSDRSFSVPQTRAAERPDQTRRCRLYQPAQAAPPIRFADELAPHLDEVMSGAKLLATAHPTVSMADLTGAFPVRAKDEAAHLQSCTQLLERAFELRASVVVFPELCGYRDVTDELRLLRPTGPALVVAGSGHVEEGGHRRNESLIWIARRSGNVPVGSPLVVRKMVPYDGELGAEPLTELGTEITVQVDGPWRAAFGICRDLLNGDTIAALSQVGVNLVVVPVCSPKTTNLAANAATLAADGPGIVVLANGPRRFRDMAQGSDPYIPMALIATPLDQVLNPTHSAVCSPPQLCTYEFETNRLAAV